MSREAAEVARRAAEIIEERGIHKGNFWGADGSVCMWGAIDCAFTEIVPGVLAVTAESGRITAELRALYPDDPSAWPGSAFNDLPETDERDVAKVLLTVADRLEVSP